MQVRELYVGQKTVEQGTKDISGPTKMYSAILWFSLHRDLSGKVVRSVAIWSRVESRKNLQLIARRRLQVRESDGKNFLSIQRL